MPVFLFISLLGRGKRFLLEGLLVYYFGPQAMEMIAQNKDDMLIVSLIVIALAILAYILKRGKKTDTAMEKL
jgi:membrane protein DedA with SNARE-associated domain